MYSSSDPGGKCISQGSLLWPRLKNKVSLVWDLEPFSPCKFQNKSGLKKWALELRVGGVSDKKRWRKKMVGGVAGEEHHGEICDVLKDVLKSNIPTALEAKH